MHLEKLQLYNFRNYEDRFFTFSEELNCIVGENGSGKTNLLDAIYFLTLCKSSIHNQDQLSIRFEEDFCMIEGVFENENKKADISINLQKGGKKSVLADKKPYEKLSEHIGKYPVVLIAPNDTDLIRDGAETRRKLFDGIFSQLSLPYLQNYLLYNKSLDQRNSLLKQFAEQNYFDADLLKIYTDQLLTLGKLIFTERKKFIEAFTPLFAKHYEAISESREKVNLNYVSDLEDENFEKLFIKNTERDLAAQRTTKGVHKDEYEFLMEDMPIKKFGSQGQRKSYAMALKLAQFDFLTQVKNTKPILLLDDIFDKLDDNRIKRLIEMIDQKLFGQVFITDARPERTRELLSGSKVNFIETGGFAFAK